MTTYLLQPNNYTPIQRHFISQKFQLQGEVPWTDTLQVKKQTPLKSFLYSFLSSKGEIGFWLQGLHICYLCQVLTNMSNLLIVINSSVNIVIYAMKDFKFRQVTWGERKYLFVRISKSILNPLQTYIKAYWSLIIRWLPGNTKPEKCYNKEICIFVCKSKCLKTRSGGCNQLMTPKGVIIGVIRNIWRRPFTVPIECTLYPKPMIKNLVFALSCLSSHIVPF